jgi:hypothetical protein
LGAFPAQCAGNRAIRLYLFCLRQKRIPLYPLRVLAPAALLPKREETGEREPPVRRASSRKNRSEARFFHYFEAFPKLQFWESILEIRSFARLKT